MFTYAEFVPI